jgi:cytochrome c-type biogenesis protein CcmF
MSKPVFQDVFKFSGRRNRQSYILALLAQIGALIVLGIVAVLFGMLWNHWFEFDYVWRHSSTDLPMRYIFTCFWEGQEGAFILWAFWNVVLGLILVHTNKFWEAPVMVVFSLVQAFLVSMILGVVVGDLKIGSSPFILLRDATQAPIFDLNPD